MVFILHFIAKMKHLSMANLFWICRQEVTDRSRVPRQVHHGYLHGIRGLAALMVVFGHCSNAGLDVLPGIDVHSSAKSGVWLFFVLSAFLLTKSLTFEIQAMPLHHALIRYTIRRIFRIMPLFSAVLLTLVIVRQMTVGDAAWHVLLAEGFWHFWTIPVEMKFYMLLPVAAIVLTAMDKSSISSFIGAMLAASAAAYWLADPVKIGQNGMSVLNYAPFFATGIALAALAVPVTERAALWLGIGALAAIPLIAPRPMQWLEGGTIVDALAFSWLYAPVWGIILLAAVKNEKMQQAFSISPLIFIGKISFGVYLMHFHIIEVVRNINFIPNAFLGSLAFGLAILAATAAYHLIEQPALRWGIRLGDRLVVASVVRAAT